MWAKALHPVNLVGLLDISCHVWTIFMGISMCYRFQCAFHREKSFQGLSQCMFVLLPHGAGSASQSLHDTKLKLTFYFSPICSNAEFAHVDLSSTSMLADSSALGGGCHLMLLPLLFSCPGILNVLAFCFLRNVISFA